MAFLESRLGLGVVGFGMQLGRGKAGKGGMAKQKTPFTQGVRTRMNVEDWPACKLCKAFLLRNRFVIRGGGTYVY